MLRLAIALVVLGAGVAHAQRPVLAGEQTFGIAHVLVHYATTGSDAVPAADADSDGVPDFVETVAATGDDAIDRFVALGFRRPLDDGSLGGDNRIDVYLRNLIAADGNAGTDSCIGDRCVGFAVAENDYAGFDYPSITEGIETVVPHELFHLVQNAYSREQSSNWLEGSAVWAVEHLHGDANRDFERFLPAFLERTFRPFERPPGGFGDNYPYGAGLWPHFLEQRFGPELVLAAWEACETAPFLDATDQALAANGSTLDDAWTEFTRWNARTGDHFVAGGYPETARAWPEALREASAPMVFVEGLSARYLPITVPADSQVVVTPTGGIRIAAWVVADGAGPDAGIELAPEGTAVPPGSYTLVVTGLTRGTIATRVDVVIEPVPPPPPEDGGCSAATPSPLLALALLALRRRRRA